MNARNLPELGQKAVEYWANQVGISANRSAPDLTGWDVILEFPQTTDPPAGIVLPLDNTPPPIQCLVQVKATDKRRGKVQVKLSNWKRLIQSPLPCFYLVLEFDGQTDCQRAYCVHVGEEYIRSFRGTLPIFKARCKQPGSWRWRLTR